MRKIPIISSAIAASLLLLLLSSWKPKEKNIDVVKPFDQKRYLGKWFEIARLDYSWEENLDNVTATYSLREDGKIEVDNKGYNTKKEKWEESIGKAKPAGDPKEGKLAVSFFGPFYSEYNIVAIDPDYQYALVAGKNTNYLWILSRTKFIPEQIKEAYLTKAQALGYDTNKLVWVKHNSINAF